MKAPRLGRPMTPFLTGIPTPTSGEPTKKKARTGERVVDDFASEEGKKFITKQDPHKTGSQFLRYKQWPRKEINKSWATFKPELACFQFFFFFDWYWYTLFKKMYLVPCYSALGFKSRKYHYRIWIRITKSLLFRIRSSKLNGPFNRPVWESHSKSINWPLID